MNMQQMMIQAQKMQRELKKALDELAKQEFTVSKSGAVTVTMMGDGSLKSIEIDDDAFDAENKEMVQDLLVLAVNELQEKIEAAKEEVNERITGSRAGFGAF
ncbi:MAG: YbaB/EbfC family nucleoid-associated protein [Bacilli bacterium]|nr:YbaB/EbfC family nucleoid-associated protein [Bacilli bacterium]